MSENPEGTPENPLETPASDFSSLTPDAQAATAAAPPPLTPEQQAQMDALLKDLNERARKDGLGVEFSQDGDNVQGKDVATGEVLAVPEAPEEPWFKCKKGHRTQGMWSHVARHIDGTILDASGPVCRVCWVRWMRKMFPASECEAPTPVQPS